MLGRLHKKFLSSEALRSLKRSFNLVPISRKETAARVGVSSAGPRLRPAANGPIALRRTKATLIYRRTGNLRAVQLLLGHTKIESTVRYLGIDVDDALAISEQTEI
jgi:integrase